MVFMAMTAYIVARGIQAGIEAANKIMMPILYVILIAIIIYSLDVTQCHGRCKILSYT